MMNRLSKSPRAPLFVLHPIFALTAIANTGVGPLLPSLARAFGLSDSRLGLLLFCIFAGMAIGALLCRGNYAQIIASGMLSLAVSCLCFPWISRGVLFPFAFFFGLSIGAPMTAVSLFAGRNYPARRASILTALNFTWSAGAMLAPLLVARLVGPYSWRAFFVALGCAAGFASLIAAVTIRDTPETKRLTTDTKGFRNLRTVAVFAVFFFLEVGVETMFGAWISTYVLRVTRTTVSLAASATAIYWVGYLISRGIAAVLVLRMNLRHILQAAVPLALTASVLFIESRSPVLLRGAILLLGVALAPVFPVALAAFFERARESSDSRFVLAFSGFGASFLPWLTGFVSSHTGNLRAGLMAGSIALLVMTSMLPFITAKVPSMSGALETVTK